MKYQPRRSCVFNLNYHIIFCPKYRKPYLYKIGKAKLLRFFNKSCIKMGATLREAEIMPEHVHLFVSVKNQYVFNLSKFMQHIKGWSSYSIRKLNTRLKQYKALWAPSYFCVSIGHISESTIRKYIRNQTTHLKSNYKYKDMVKVINSEKHYKTINSLSNYESRKCIKGQHINNKNKFIRPTISNSSEVMTSDKTPVQHIKLLPT